MTPPPPPRTHALGGGVISGRMTPPTPLHCGSGPARAGATPAEKAPGGTRPWAALSAARGLRRLLRSGGLGANEHQEPVGRAVPTRHSQAPRREGAVLLPLALLARSPAGDGREPPVLWAGLGPQAVPPHFFSPARTCRPRAPWRGALPAGGCPPGGCPRAGGAGSGEAARGAAAHPGGQGASLAGRPRRFLLRLRCGLFPPPPARPRRTRAGNSRRPRRRAGPAPYKSFLGGSPGPFHGSGERRGAVRPTGPRSRIPPPPVRAGSVRSDLCGRGGKPRSVWVCRTSMRPRAAGTAFPVFLVNPQ